MKVSIIGAGSRSQDYIEALRSGAAGPAEITALADIDGDRLARFAAQHFGEAKPALYTDYRQMLTEDRADAVLVCTPDCTHREIAAACIAAGRHMLLEKPLASTIEDCVEIYRLSRTHTGSLMLAFGLRTAPFYQKIRDIVASGELGTLMAVEATESMGALHGASFFRRWQRFRKNSGGFFNYKCCHDLDMLNWVLGLEPVSVTAFGGRSYFNARPDAADRCGNCTLRESCHYAYDPKDYLELFGPMNSLEDLCVFNSEKDIIDHGAMLLQYPGDVTATFTVALLNARPQRTLTVHGSEATLLADGRRQTIAVQHVRTGIETIHDLSGAKATGGDAVLLKTLFDGIRSGRYRNDGRAGLMSSGTALLAERSMELKRAMELKELGVE